MTTLFIKMIFQDPMMKYRTPLNSGQNSSDRECPLLGGFTDLSSSFHLAKVTVTLYKTNFAFLVGPYAYFLDDLDFSNTNLTLFDLLWSPVAPSIIKSLFSHILTDPSRLWLTL